MSDTLNVQVGDWVCFPQLSLPTYAKVEYVNGAMLVTTAGSCRVIDVLEVRKKEPVSNATRSLTIPWTAIAFALKRKEAT